MYEIKVFFIALLMRVMEKYWNKKVGYAVNSEKV